jgi:hypothetical protein
MSMGFIMPLAVEFAILGALAIQLLGLMNLSRIPKNERPDFKDIIYWVPFLIHPTLGGGLAYAYVASGHTLAPLVAINVGITAPLVLKTIANNADGPIKVDSDA